MTRKKKNEFIAHMFKYLFMLHDFRKKNPPTPKTIKKRANERALRAIIEQKKSHSETTKNQS